MTGPVPTDPVSDVVDAFLRAMKAAFNPADSIAPPLGGGSTDVRFFAGDGALPGSLIPSGSGRKCPPLLWVRVDRRYRYQAGRFPAAYVGDAPCKDSLRAVAIEVGIGRCSTMEASPTWSQLEREAEIALDDSWRIELALCAAEAELRGPKRVFATDTVAPVGPEGGITAWTGMAYVQF